MKEVIATRPISPMSNGVTKPFLINCSGEEYVVKFLQNPEGNKILINEFVCAEIAQLLNLPLAEPALVNVDEQFIIDYGETLTNHIKHDIKPGIHFGSKKIKKAFPINSTSMLEKATNINSISSLIIFDHLICNKDRDSNAGNLLFDASNKSIVVIDHSHAFDIGPLWDDVQLNHRIGQEFYHFPMNGYVYNKLVQFIDGHNPFHDVIYKVGLIDENKLNAIMNKIPESWNISNEEKKSLIGYLLDRVERVDDILTCLKPVLPNWKGGIT